MQKAATIGYWENAHNPKCYVKGSNFAKSFSRVNRSAWKEAPTRTRCHKPDGQSKFNSWREKREGKGEKMAEQSEADRVAERMRKRL